MSAVYFVRQLGKVRGPFAPDHLDRLVAAGLIGPAAEVSADRAAWCSLEAHLTGDAVPGVVSAPPADNFELDLSALLPPTPPAEASAGSEWFDSVDLGAMGDV